MSLTDLLLFGPEYSAIRDTERQVQSLHRMAERASRAQLAALQRQAEASLQAGETAAGVLDSVTQVQETLRAGFAALVHRLDQQTELVGQILQRLDQPERTRAREKQRDGVRAYNHLWIDEAISDFQAAVEIDRYDYMSYWYLAVLYTFSKMDDDRARWAFSHAGRYSWPEHPTPSAAACLGLAFVEYANNRLTEAEPAAREAVQRDPNLAIAHYDLARYLALQGRCPEAVAELRAAILGDPKLFAAAAAEPDLRRCWDGT